MKLPHIDRYDLRWAIEKHQTRVYIWLARHLPEPIVQMGLLKAGWTRIRHDEVVTDVGFTELLRRRP